VVIKTPRKIRVKMLISWKNYQIHYCRGWILMWITRNNYMNNWILIIIITLYIYLLKTTNITIWYNPEYKQYDLQYLIVFLLIHIILFNFILVLSHLINFILVLCSQYNIKIHWMHIKLIHKLCNAAGEGVGITGVYDIG